MSTIKVKGLDQAQKKLKEMQRTLKELDGKHSVTFKELFPPSFMRKYTSFDSMSDLLEAGGFHVETQEDFKAIPDEPFDEHIAATTKFKSWQDMMQVAGKEYVTRKLGF